MQLFTGHKEWFHLCYVLSYSFVLFLIRQDSNLTLGFLSNVCVKILCPAEQTSGACMDNTFYSSQILKDNKVE